MSERVRGDQRPSRVMRDPSLIPKVAAVPTTDSVRLRPAGTVPGREPILVSVIVP